MAIRKKRLTRDEKREQTRARLLAAAQRLFTKQGFHGTSVEEIADAAGYTRGAFYSNFGDKDDIFLALLDKAFSARITELTAIFEESTSLADALAGVIRSNTTRDASATTILNTEFFLYAARNPGVRSKLAQRQRTERKAYERAIKAQFDAIGLEVPFDLHDAAVVMLILDLGAYRLSLIDPEDVPRNFFFTAVLQLFEAAQALAREKAAQK